MPIFMTDLTTLLGWQSRIRQIKLFQFVVFKITISVLLFAGPKLAGVLPDKLTSVVFSPLNETSFEVNLRVPKELEGRSGFYKVFFTSGLQ